MAKKKKRTRAQMRADVARKMSETDRAAIRESVKRQLELMIGMAERLRDERKLHQARALLPRIEALAEDLKHLEKP